MYGRRAARRIGVVLLLGCASQPTAARAQTTSAPTVARCDDQRTMEAVAQTLGVNLVANRWDAWVMGFDWAHVGFESWSSNLEKGWQWDETQFGVNMFLHPYHGAVLFNAARGNCLTFWESIPVTFLGAWTWEYFGETFRPSLNDFWMTGYGGVVLGEMLHRVSAAIIDQEASGRGRIGRELAATLVNPMGGFNRLIRGQWTRQAANPADRLPGSYLARVKAGGRRVREDGDPGSSTSSPTMLLEVRFGDVIDTEYRAPFDVINLLAQVSADGGGVNILRVVGRLYGKDLTGAGSGNRHQLVINQRFDYVNNPVYHFGEQSLELGIHSRWPTGLGGLRLNTRVAGDVVMLGAIDALDAGMGQRDIDYGPGLGALVEVSLDVNGQTYVSFYNRARYLRSVSGAPANHTLLFSGFDVTIPITSQIGIGAYVSGDSRHSYYSDLPNDSRSYLETRIYLTWNLAHGIAG